MSRPICWHCGKQLMYVSGIPVFAKVVDPIGAEHHVHKECAKQIKSDHEDDLRDAYRMRESKS